MPTYQVAIKYRKLGSTGGFTSTTTSVRAETQNDAQEIAKGKKAGYEVHVHGCRKTSDK